MGLPCLTHRSQFAVKGVWKDCVDVGFAGVGAPDKGA